MRPSQDVIDISDEESDGSFYEFDQGFLVDDNGPQHDGEAMDLDDSSYAQPDEIGGSIDSSDTCLTKILDVFPDISHPHVQQLYNQHISLTSPSNRADGTAVGILIDQILSDGAYPKEKDRNKDLKRKRSDKSIDAEETAKWQHMERRIDPEGYSRVAKAALLEQFDYVPANYIQEVLNKHKHYYGAFFDLVEADRTYEVAEARSFTKLKRRRTNQGTSASDMMANLRSTGHNLEVLEQEMTSAFQRREREDAQRALAMEVEQAEQVDDLNHVTNGEVMECACCYETVTMPKITHCDGEEPHFFCLDCARRNANNDIGNSQYALKCMDFSNCKATFSREQRYRFLDDKTREKLERLQQQEELRLAELDNLCTCPFCDFAAICPPIEDDREFRCQNPECAEISCRLCKLKSHLPASCAEHKKENGISERRVIEEARTEALIRTCGKCKVRILKEEGCNKVICTSCHAALCDVCGQDITKVMYNHFDDTQRRAPSGLIIKPGGKCPLYDESNDRKDRQVEAAEKEALDRVRAEHPEISEDDLKIKFAKDIQQSVATHQYVHRPHRNWAHDPGFPMLPEFENIHALDPQAQEHVNVWEAPQRDHEALRAQIMGENQRQRLQLEQQQQQMRVQAQANIANARQIQQQIQAQAEANLGQQQANVHRLHQRMQAQAQAIRVGGQAPAQEAHLEQENEGLFGPGRYGENWALGLDNTFRNRWAAPNPPVPNDNHAAPERNGLYHLPQDIGRHGRQHAPEPQPADRRNRSGGFAGHLRTAVRGHHPGRARNVDGQLQNIEEPPYMGRAAAPFAPPREPRRRRAVNVTP